jgi:HTH-type transcriptional regulator/antitoxin HigA
MHFARETGSQPATSLERNGHYEAIKFRMEQQGLTRRDLEEIIGTRTRIAEVLSRKRGLSIAMIRRLHERLGISAEVLIRPSRKDAA